MLQVLRERLNRPRHTLAFPDGPVPTLPDRFRGLPVLDQSQCQAGCAECVSACPTDSISQTDGRLQIDLGRCLFCLDCTEACPTDAVGFSNTFAMATRTREDLNFDGRELKLAEPLDAKILRVLGRSLKLRHVSAGGCGACNAEVAALENVVFDLSRFGIEFVNSPRHADGLLVTGPVTSRMRPVLEQTYAEMAAPKIVIAAGTCAISGGVFAGLPEVCGGVEGILPIDLYVPGCPPHPLTILDGILRMLNRRGQST